MTQNKASAKTLYDKLWDSHWVCEQDDGSSLIYIDKQLLHEVTSPQAFAGLRMAGRKPWRVNANLATPDHNVPTEDRAKGLAGITDEVAKIQVVTLDQNCKEFGITQFDINDPRQGIVHVIGPEQGATLPGMTVVCGDSHTSTHGAFASLAHGIGTSEVEHVLATQCLRQRKMKNFALNVQGLLVPGVSAKDLILAIIGEIGTAGGTGYAVEFRGEAISALSMEGRMTLCNMAIEAGARAGLVAVDDKTIRYVKDRPFAPKDGQWQLAQAYWQTLHSDPGAHFDHQVWLDAGKLSPQLSWGTSPEMVMAVDGSIPSLEQARDQVQRDSWQQALTYMGLEAGQKAQDIPVDQVFIGSCTNGRIEDMRAAAQVVQRQPGVRVNQRVKRAMVVPGSGLVKAQAETEGLHEIFLQAGFEWRDPGCSMCLAMNPDKLAAKEHCASTSNRNFEGRQGYGGRTHLVSPAMAAAAALAGHFTDVREWF